jgi:hypothetical protein
MAASARAEEARLERGARVDNRRMEYLRRVFGALGGDEAEVEARCLMALSAPTCWVASQAARSIRAGWTGSGDQIHRSWGTGRALRPVILRVRP